MGADGAVVAAIQRDEKIRDPDPHVSVIAKSEIVARAQCEYHEIVVRALQEGCDLQEAAGSGVRQLLQVVDDAPLARHTGRGKTFERGQCAV